MSSWSACLVTAESSVRQPLGPRHSSAAALVGSSGRLERELEVIGIWFLEVLDALAPEPGCALDGDLFGHSLDVFRRRCRSLVEADQAGGCVADIGAVEYEHVEVRIQA